jgi:hypothetical protein
MVDMPQYAHGCGRGMNSKSPRKCVEEGVHQTPGPLCIYACGILAGAARVRRSTGPRENARCPKGSPVCRGVPPTPVGRKAGAPADWPQAGLLEGPPVTSTVRS